MKIAYLTTMYPAVSHTFIRREILALETLGHEVVRFAIRSPEVCVDEDDSVEYRKTTYILKSSPIFMLASVFQSVLSSPRGFFNALVQSLKMYYKSERGFITHLAYFVESCVLVKLMKKHHTERVHVHFGTNATAVALLAKMMSNVRYSFTVHGPDEFDAPIGLSLRDKIEHSEFVAGISNFCVSQMKRWVGHEFWEKLKIIRCSVDAKFLDDPPPTSSSNQLVCVGRLSAQKGHFVLMSAFKKLLIEFPYAKLVLAGDGEMRSELEKFIETERLQDNIFITGWVDGGTVRKHLSHSKGLVLPSFAEGLPVVIMEAFALQRPVITSTIAGIPELVVNGENGLLITPNDEQQLLEAMIKIFTMSEKELHVMGQHGRAAVMAAHNIEKEAQKLELLFKQYS